jgi:hypothetical protein
MARAVFSTINMAGWHESYNRLPPSKKGGHHAEGGPQNPPPGYPAEMPGAGSSGIAVNFGHCKALGSPTKRSRFFSGLSRWYSGIAATMGGIGNLELEVQVRRLRR